MRGLDSEGNRNEFLKAADLINAVAQAGPGNSLSVRIRSKDGRRIIGMGRTSWSDDRAPGGPVVIFPNPKNKEEEWLIALGGGVSYESPPKMNSSTNPRMTGFPFGEVRAHQKPIDPMAQGYSFELVSE